MRWYWCIGVFREKKRMEQKFLNDRLCFARKSGPKFSRRFVSPLSIFSAHFGFTWPIFRPVGLATLLEQSRRMGGRRGRGKADRKTFVSWTNRTTAASLLQYTVNWHSSVSSYLRNFSWQFAYLPSLVSLSFCISFFMHVCTFTLL